MKYSLVPSAWVSAFAVPAQVVDKHIKIASGQQLKVLLWLLRHSADEFEIEELAKGVGLSVGEVHDNMQYWVEKGLVVKDNNFAENAVKENLNKEVTKVESKEKKEKEEKKEETKEKEKTKEAPKKAEFAPLPDITPTHEQVATRLLESPELKCLYMEAQERLGKTIGYDTQAKLLMIHDCYGLPVEVILTIIEYAVSKGKTSINYISKIGKDWGEREIDTLEKADKHIKKLCDNEKRWKKFCGMFKVDPPKYTKSRNDYLIKWNEELGFSLDMIYLAYEETINNINKINFRYTNKILLNWKDQKIKTTQDIKKDKDEYTKKFTSKKQSVASDNASYDLEKFREKARGPLEYKRRNG